MTPTIKQALEKIKRGEEITPEEVEAVSAELPDVFECLRRIAESLSHWLVEVLPMWVEAIAAAIPQLLEAEATLDRCPNPRVLHLAKHGKKWRTRKKNRARAYRLIETEGATDDQGSTEKLPTTEE